MVVKARVEIFLLGFGSYETSPPIHSDNLPGHEIRCRQIRNSSSYVVARTGSMKRNAANILFIRRFARKLNRARRDAIHKDFWC
jgi:hypothetical protein